ncbi:hypothetical protein GOODEAATRI_033182, partial [Goodea atripinnis]
ILLSRLSMDLIFMPTAVPLRDNHIHSCCIANDYKAGEDSRTTLRRGGSRQKQLWSVGGWTGR